MSHADFMKDFNRPIIAEFRSKGGRVDGWGDARLLLLTTTGARSGQPHVTPLSYCLDGERLFVLAADVGQPRHPAWYHNLLAHPDVTVEIGGESWPARARVLTDGPERRRLYELRACEAPVVREYQQKTERLFPVVILERLAG